MHTLVGVFNSRHAAEETVGGLRAVGLGDDSIVFLSPESSEQAVETVPTTDAESPGIGKAISSYIGAVIGGGVGLGVGSGVASLLVPGVGVIYVVGIAAGALLGIGGAACRTMMCSFTVSCLSRGARWWSHRLTMTSLRRLRSPFCTSTARRT